MGSGWGNVMNPEGEPSTPTYSARNSQTLKQAALEKTCCALAWAAHRLRHYMLNFTTMLIARMDPLKYIFEKPSFAKQKRALVQIHSKQRSYR